MNYLADLTGPATAARLTAESVIVLPIGSTEHHGPHLPLSTDLVIAEAYATALAEAASEVDAWLLPSLAVTKSDEHTWAPGTLSLSADTLLAVVREIGRSLMLLPARRLVFVNGHGGNSALLQVALREVRRETGFATFLIHPAVPVDQGGRASDPGELGLGIHGGHEETSLMLHLRPGLVHMDLAERQVPEQLTHFRQVGFGKPVSFGWLSGDFGTGGVIGDPTGATADDGRRRFEAMVAAGADALREISRFPVPPAA